MNTLFDLAVYTESINDELSDICLRGKLLIEESFKEYELNLEESKLKVLTESGTSEDLSYLYEAAGNGLIEKLKKIIKRIKDSIISGVQKMRDAVNKFFAKSKAEAALKDAAKAAANNPKVKNSKVSVIDVDKNLKELDKLEAKVDKKLALFKKGKFKEKDSEELEQIEKDFSKVKMAVASTTIVVTVAVAIALVARWRNEMEKNNIQLPDFDGFDVDMSPTEIAPCSTAMAMKGQILKERYNIIKNGIIDCINSLKVQFTGSGDLPDPTLDLSNIRESEESAESGIDTDAYLESTLSYLDAEEYLESDEQLHDEATAYLESLEAELFDSNDDETYAEATEYLESLEAELFSEEDDSFVESADDEMDTIKSYFESILASR